MKNTHIPLQRELVQCQNIGTVLCKHDISEESKVKVSQVSSNRGKWPTNFVTLSSALASSDTFSNSAPINEIQKYL